MAKFAPQFIQGLINPAYLPGMFTAAQNIGAAPRLAKMEEERKALLNQENELFQQGYQSTMQDTADPSALRMRISQLSDLMAAATTEGDRSRIGARINSLTSLLEQTTNKAKANQVQSVITAENAVNQLNKTIEAQQFEETDEFVGPAAIMAGDEKRGEKVQLERQNVIRARNALSKRIEDLKSDPSVAKQVRDTKLQAEYDQLQQSIKMNTARGQAVAIDLSKYKVGTPQFEERAKLFRDQGFGVAVDGEITRQSQTLKALEEIRELRLSNAPITNEQKTRLKQAGLPVTKTNRNEMLARDKQIKLDMAFRDYDPLEGQAVVETINFFLDKLSREDDRWNVFKDDIGDVAQDLDAEDVKKLSEIFEGRSAPEIEASVMDYLIAKKPDAWKATKEYREEDRRKAEKQQDRLARREAAVTAKLKDMNLEEGSEDYEVQKLLLEEEYDRLLQVEIGRQTLNNLEFRAF